MSRVEGEEERALVAVPGGTLHGQVDAAEGDGGERLAVDVPQHGVGHHDDRPPQDVRQGQDVDLLQALVESRGTRGRGHAVGALKHSGRGVAVHGHADPGPPAVGW